MPEMKPTPGTIEINLNDWGLDGVCLWQITEAIKDAFEETPPFAYLPHQFFPYSNEYNGAPVSDPLIIEIAIPLGPNLSDHPTFHVSMGELVDELINFGARERTVEFIAAMRALLDNAEVNLDDLTVED